ncbi:MAG: bifunctional demethylmenaquinone methyltransferase/2-methoxy-6-polyprenyl-1,4-benzoquinol methylase UbiE [Syntrophorhabdus sp.]
MEKHINKAYPSVRDVTEKERVGMVKEIFSTITPRYDFLNHFLSLRRDMAWRRFAIKKMHFFKTKQLLDIACGTGDLSVDAAQKYPDITVCGVDFVSEMIRAGQKKINREGLTKRIQFMTGDALHLPFRDNTFDVAAMAFGIRNIPDRQGALREMRRVIVPGGQIMILEMTFTRNRFFQIFYNIYLNYILPRLAKRFSSNPGAYHYLADSIMNFPTHDQFTALMEETGIENVDAYSLTFGVTYLHVGTKPACSL